MLKGNSNRVIKMPWSILRARSPRACLPWYLFRVSCFWGSKSGGKYRLKPCMMLVVMQKKEVESKLRWTSPGCWTGVCRVYPSLDISMPASSNIRYAGMLISGVSRIHTVQLISQENRVQNLSETLGGVLHISTLLSTCNETFLDMAPGTRASRGGRSRGHRSSGHRGNGRAMKDVSFYQSEGWNNDRPDSLVERQFSDNEDQDESSNGEARARPYLLSNVNVWPWMSPARSRTIHSRGMLTTKTYPDSHVGQ